MRPTKATKKARKQQNKAHSGMSSIQIQHDI